MARVLVTGASGFIGRHLVAVLRRHGHRVRAALRQASGGPWDEAVVVGEIGPQTAWHTALADVDQVVHLAALAHRTARDAARLTDAYRSVNAEGTWRLAEEAARHGVQRLVFVSSVAVTGSSSETPVTEASPPAPDTPYGESKLAAERGLAERLASGLPDWCIVRPPLIYGPGNPGNMARLQRLLRVQVPLPLGAIHNRRSFLYVGNLTDLLRTVLDHPAASRRVFTVADAEVVSTPELLHLIGSATGRPVRLLAIPAPILRALARVGDAVSLVAGRSIGLDSYALERLTGSLVVDTRTVATTLGWTPPVSLAEGLRRTLIT